MLLLWRRVKSVADVLKSTRQNGFFQGGLDALLGRWKAVCDQGPCVPLRSLDPWVRLIPLICMVSICGFSIHLGLLTEFVRQVVPSRRDSGLRRWATWLREDLGSRPYIWLRPDFVLPPLLPSLLSKTRKLRLLASWLSHLIDAEFCKARMPYFRWSGHPVVTKDQFLEFVGPFLPQEPVLDLPRMRGQDLFEVVKAKKSTTGGLDGWAWNEIKALLLAWLSGLAVLLNMVELLLSGHRGYWMRTLL